VVLPIVDPQQLAKIQAVSKFINAKMTVNYKENSILLELTADQAEARELIPSLIEQLSGLLATQLNTFFAMSGELVEIGKKEKKTT